MGLGVNFFDPVLTVKPFDADLPEFGTIAITGKEDYYWSSVAFSFWALVAGFAQLLSG